MDIAYGFILHLWRILLIEISECYFHDVDYKGAFKTTNLIDLYSSLTIRKTNFTDLVGDCESSGIYFSVDILNNNISIVDCHFERCICTESGGSGAIYAKINSPSNGNYFIIKNCTFIDNSGMNTGAILLVYNNAITLQFHDNIFLEN